MKRKLLFILSIVLCVFLLSATALADGPGIAINETTFPDSNFRAYISQSIDSDRNGYLSPGERAVTEISVGKKGITSLQGIEFFSALTELYCYNNQLTELDVSSLISLKRMNCSENPLTSLNVSGCTALTFLNCQETQLTSLNVSGCTALQTLWCMKNHKLTSLNASGCTALKTLNCWENRLTSLNVSGCTALVDLDCMKNQLTSLNVSGCKALKTLDCMENQLTSLNVSGCKALETLDCYSNHYITSLNVSDCKALKTLSCDFNQLTSLNVSDCKALKTLCCSSNQLTNLNVSGCTALSHLTCGYNQLTSLNVSGCTALVDLECWVNRLTSLNVSGCTALVDLQCLRNQLTSLNVSDCKALKTLDCRENQLTSLDIAQNTKLEFLSCCDNRLTTLDISTAPALVSVIKPEYREIDGNYIYYYNEINDDTYYGVLYDAATQLITGNEPPEPEPPEPEACDMKLYDEETEIQTLYYECGSYRWKYNIEDDFYSFRMEFDIQPSEDVLIGTVNLVLPDGFSFAKDSVVSSKPVSLNGGTTHISEQVYPLYSTTTKDEFRVRVTGSYEGDFVFPIQHASDEGNVLYENMITHILGTKSFLTLDFPRLFGGGTETRPQEDLINLGVYLVDSVYTVDYIVASLRNLGFRSVRFYYAQNEDDVACAFARKTLIVDGKVQTLIVAIVRGTSLNQYNEWVGNFRVWPGEGSRHAGFENAKANVLDRLKTYCRVKQIDPANSYIYICGHSRGAAVANLLAYDVSTSCRDTVASSVVAYTYATPNTTKNPVNTGNIFNYVFSFDVVGFVPAGYGKYGTTFVFGNDDPETSDGLGVTMHHNQTAIQTILVDGGRLNQVMTEFSSCIGELLKGDPDMGDPMQAEILCAHCPENYMYWIYNESGRLEGLSERFQEICNRHLATAQKVRNTYNSIAGGLVIGGTAIGIVAAVTHPTETAMLLTAAIKNHFNARVKIARVSCPVDVTVYNLSNEVIASTVDHVLQGYDSQYLYALSLGESDYFIIPEDIDCRFVINGNNSGTMDIVLCTIGEVGGLEESCVIADVPVSVGVQYSLPMSRQTPVNNSVLTNVHTWEEFTAENLSYLIDEINFPDEAFRSYVSENFDTDGNGTLSMDELTNVTEIDVSCSEAEPGEISTLQGVELFPALTALDCSWNRLTSLSLSANSELIILNCSNNLLTELDLSQNTALKLLRCENNQLTTLDISACKSLMELVNTADPDSTNGYIQYGSLENYEEPYLSYDAGVTLLPFNGDPLIPDGLNFDGTEWHFYKNGRIDYTYRGLAYREDIGWWYVANGTIDFTYTGFAEGAEVGWWYCEGGTINFSYTGIGYGEGLGWAYAVNGQFQNLYTGLVYGEGVGWVYVQNGAIDESYTGLAYREDIGWWYVRDGHIKFDYTGLASAEDAGWWYVKNGTIDFTFTGFADEGELGLYYCEGGRLMFVYTGLAYDPAVGWRFVRDGAVDTSYTGLAYREGVGWWYCVNGAIDFGFTGIGYAEGVGHWYCENGAINFGFTGLYQDANLGWVYVAGGALQTGYTGLVYDPAVGWWYVRGGRIDFDFTGVAYRADIGWWYVEGGSITFGYNGIVEYGGHTWSIVNSQATQIG